MSASPLPDFKKLTKMDDGTLMILHVAMAAIFV